MQTTLTAVFVYLLIALAIGILSCKRHMSSSDFIIGGRSLNFWLTALAAHASDMSNWLFMGYPAMIFLGGVFNIWIAIGLILCMFFNWRLIAPKIRVLSEETNTVTLSGLFANSLDSSGGIRNFSSAFCCIFYTVYISAGLIGLGQLSETLLGVSYQSGILFGTLIVVLYVIIGGFSTLAWLDFFQGTFLMGVILFVPLYLLPRLGGFEAISLSLYEKGLATSLFPSFHYLTYFKIISMTLGWGLGYFGQPHIITKFMGIKKTSEIRKSQRVGLSWMVLSLLGATLVGLVATAFFRVPLNDPEMIFISIVELSFSPFISGFILCAIIAAIVNVTSAQLLTLSSIISQDFYKKLCLRSSGKREILITRLSILIVAMIALFIAYLKPSSIYSLVLYAWSGLGATFGPLLILLLYSKKVTKFGAWVGILSGGILSAVWPFINTLFPIDIEPLLPAFSVSLLLNWLVSKMTLSRENLFEFSENLKLFKD
ncbi:MAG: sodium/proline symporter [Simkania sp.]|nr:sodium/proline symporter [Simkania sp.]